MVKLVAAAWLATWALPAAGQSPDEEPAAEQPAKKRAKRRPKKPSTEASSDESTSADAKKRPPKKKVTSKKKPIKKKKPTDEQDPPPDFQLGEEKTDPPPQDTPPEAIGHERPTPPTDPPPEAAESHGDVVEKIEIPIDVGPGPSTGATASPSTGDPAGGPAPDPAQPPPTTPTPDPPTTETYDVNLSGWARGAGNFFFARARRDIPEPLTVPYHRFRSDEQLYLRIRVARGKSFAAVLSGLLAHTFQEQDAPAHQDFDLFNGEGATTSFDALLNEAYVGFFWKSVDLRLGQQRLAWGRGDAFAPNDVINPVDSRDPVLAESEVLHIPTLLARVDAQLPFGSAQLVFSPFFTPNRNAVYENNWGLVQYDAPKVTRALLFRSNEQVDSSLRDALEPLLIQSELPQPNFSTPSVGLKLQASGDGFDVSGYYHYGFAYNPEIVLNQPAWDRLEQVDFTLVPKEQLAPLLAGERIFTSTYVRRHHVGLDAQMTLGRFSLRSDVSYDSKMVFTRKADFSSTLLPTAQAAVAVEYDTGDVGQVVLFEGLYQRVLNAPADGALMFVNENNFAVATLLRYTFFDTSRVRLELEGRGSLSFRPRSFLFRPQVSLKWENFAIKAGAVIVDGDERSAGHYFRRNDSLYLVLRYAL